MDRQLALSIYHSLGAILAIGVLRKKTNENTGKPEWALVSKKKPSKVLKWFGGQKPSRDTVLKHERRVQYFKHKG